jgi:competence protein ComEC
LILGHHGSQTSSSQAFLTQARPGLAIASARRARYGHPHRKVVSRLRQKKIPTLTTEDWGSLFFSLPNFDSGLRQPES